MACESHQYLVHAPTNEAQALVLVEFVHMPSAVFSFGGKQTTTCFVLLKQHIRPSVNEVGTSLGYPSVCLSYASSQGCLPFDFCGQSPGDYRLHHSRVQQVQRLLRDSCLQRLPNLKMPLIPGDEIKLRYANTPCSWYTRIPLKQLQGALWLLLTPDYVIAEEGIASTIPARIAAVRVWREDGRFLNVGAVEICHVSAVDDPLQLFDDQPFDWITECDVLEEADLASRINRRPNQNSAHHAVGIDDESYLFLGCPMGYGRLAMCPQFFEWLKLQSGLESACFRPMMHQ